MQEIFGFLGLVIVISASGVMSPGPLFAANVMYGLREGKNFRNKDGQWDTLLWNFL